MAANPFIDGVCGTDSCQARFHARCGHLRNPHVRALAWLLTAPNLLDRDAAQWQGRIATLSQIDPLADREHDAWLSALDRAPAELESWLDVQPLTRLGRYAEKLMAFYFRHLGLLAGHGVQVQNGKNDTVGEFDFLLRQGEALLHWEFATKFYLLEPTGTGRSTDYFVGPNLADTLGAKMHKILERQLALARHPAAQTHLPQPVTAAQALVKGWLFYRDADGGDGAAYGVRADHCRGFWCALGELDAWPDGRFMVLPRLSWLAPAAAPWPDAIDTRRLRDLLAQHFRHDTMPVLVALVCEEDGRALETARGFVVPDDWRERAARRGKSAGFAEP